MNLPELHKKVLSLIDQSRSGIIHYDMINSAINLAIDNVTSQYGLTGISIDQIDYRNMSHLRDYITTDVFVYDGSQISKLIHDKYKDEMSRLLDIQLNIGSHDRPVWIIPTPIAKKDRDEITGNTFLKPRRNAWTTVYFSIMGSDLFFHTPTDVNIVELKCSWYRKPRTVEMGTIYSQGSDLSSLVGLVPVVVYTPYAEINGKEYLMGSVLDLSKDTQIGSGLLVLESNQPDVAPLIENEVVMTASRILSAAKLGVLNEPQKQ